MRVIRKSATASNQEVTDLLSSLFVVELFKPSRCLWVVSPWVSDIPLVDNRLGQFPLLNNVGLKRVGLADLLLQLALIGTTVVVATRDLQINQPFLARLRSGADKLGDGTRIHVTELPGEERMHAKAMAGDDFVIAGSMNFTFSGAMLNEEQVQLHTDPEFVAATQMDLHQRFGGTLR